MAPSRVLSRGLLSVEAAGHGVSGRVAQKICFYMSASVTLAQNGEPAALLPSSPSPTMAPL